MGDFVVDLYKIMVIEKHKRKNKTVWIFTNLCKIFKSGRHKMLSKLS